MANKTAKAKAKKVSRAASAVAKKAGATLGELIAAAYDTVGNEVRDVARILASPELACAIQKRIVLVQ